MKDVINGQSRNRLNTLDYLSQATEFSMFSRDVTTLVKFANSIYGNEDIKGIVFVSDTLDIIAHSSSFIDLNPDITNIIVKHDAGDLIKLGENSCIYSPIYSEGLGTGTNDPKQLLGYVLMITSDEYINNIKQKILINAFLFLFITIFILILLSFLYSKKIDQYVFNLVKAINDLSLGHYDKYKNDQYPREVRTLYTGINKLSNELSNYRDKMDTRVNKATNELSVTLRVLEDQNKALDASRKFAESANKSKDMFLARMSHELRTPINSLIGFSKLARDEQSSEKKCKYNEIILNSSEHLLSLIDDLLDLEILELGGLKINKTSFELRQIFEDIFSIYTSQLNLNNIKLIKHIDDEISEIIYTDRTRLLQILNNLISNSIKFTKHGEIRVSVILLSSTDTLQKIEFVIADTGCGIKKEEKDNVFKSFVQLNESFDSSHGAGLGLAIVKQIVQAMGGEIHLESTEAVGTKFSVILDIETRPNGDVTTNYDTNSKNEMNERTKQILKNMNILIAEDHVKVVCSWVCL